MAGAESEALNELHLLFL